MDKHSDGHHQVLHWVAYGKLEVELYKSLTVHKRWIQPLLHHHLVCESIQTLFMKQRWNSKCWTNEKQKINTSSYRHPPFLHPNLHIRLLPSCCYEGRCYLSVTQWGRLIHLDHDFQNVHPALFNRPKLAPEAIKWWGKCSLRWQSAAARVYSSLHTALFSPAAGCLKGITTYSRYLKLQLAASETEQAFPRKALLFIHFATLSVIKLCWSAMFSAVSIKGQ